MGFFGKLFDGAKNLFGKVANFGSGLMSKVSDAAHEISNMPVIGDVVKAVAATPIGQEITGTFNSVQNMLQDISGSNNPNQT